MKQVMRNLGLIYASLHCLCNWVAAHVTGSHLVSGAFTELVQHTSILGGTAIVGVVTFSDVLLSLRKMLLMQPLGLQLESRGLSYFPSIISS
jgi:hypothetical protein